MDPVLTGWYNVFVRWLGDISDARWRIQCSLVRSFKSRFEVSQHRL